MKSITSLFLFFFCTQFLSAQQIDSIRFESKQLGEERLITVWKPANYTAEKKYSVIYTFDAAWMFGLLHPVVEYYSSPDLDRLPPSIVVGIHFKDRNEDMGINWDGGGLNQAGLGFKAYVEKEVIPFVQTNYSTSSFSCIFGHSNSSTYLNQFLFQEKPSFQAYAPISQYLLPNDSLAINQWIPQHRDKQLYYFLASAEGDAPFRLQSGKDHLRLFKQADSQFPFEHLILEKANHQTMAAQAIPFALESLFRDYQHMDEGQAKQMAKETQLDAISYVQKELNKVGQVYGLDISWNIMDYFFAYEMALHQSDTASIYKITQNYHKQHPEDLSMCFIEGQVFEQMKAYENAKQSYIRNLQINEDAAYLSYFRLMNLLEQNIGEADLAIKIGLSGIEKEISPRLHYQVAKIAAKHQVSLAMGLKQIEIAEASFDVNQAIGLEYIYLRKGQLLAGLGKQKEAKLAFERALEIRPDFKEAQEEFQKQDH